jgi:hypothetical protein
VSVAGAPGVFVAGDWVGPLGLLADAALSSGSQAGKLAAAAANPSPDAAGAGRTQVAGAGASRTQQRLVG